MEELFNYTCRKLGKEDLAFIYGLYTLTRLPLLVNEGLKKAEPYEYRGNFTHTERYEFFKKQDGILFFCWYCVSECLTKNV